MSRRIGNFGRFFTNLKNSLFVTKQKARFVGKDQFGNKYFEKEGDDAHNLRSARYIEERKDLGPFDHPEVPVEWEAWLRGRRRNPPTELEIQKNYQKMIQTKLRAEQIEGKFSTKPGESETESSSVGVEVTSNKTTVDFPKYEEYEIQPGVKSDENKR